MKERLKELRKKLGLKQRELAERLGVNVGTIGNFECGNVAIPPARIYQICKEFGVNREWFEHGEGEMFEPGKSDQELLKESALRLFNQLSEEGKKAVIEALREELKIGSLPSEKQREIDEWNRRVEEANRGISIRNSQIEKVVNNQR